jgi:hypothetical protein
LLVNRAAVVALTPVLEPNVVLKRQIGNRLQRPLARREFRNSILIKNREMEPVKRAETDDLGALFGYPEDLFNRCDSFQHFADAVVVKRGHAALYRGLADVLSRCTLEGELADL